jgi:hypothetical protein
MWFSKTHAKSARDQDNPPWMRDLELVMSTVHQEMAAIFRNEAHRVRQKHKKAKGK